MFNANFLTTLIVSSDSMFRIRKDLIEDNK